MGLNEIYFSTLSPLPVYFFHQCCSAWILLIKRIKMTRYDIIWTFQSMNLLTFSLVCIYLIPWPRAGCDTRPIYSAECSWFEFRVFLLLDWLPALFTHSRKNWWIHTFRKIIKSKWNSKSLIQDLNLGCRFNVLQWWALHREHPINILTEL